MNLHSNVNLKTILVVDDEPVLRAIVREILHEEGFAVIEAADGGVMLEIMARQRPDLVLMDVMMPGVDGREAYRQLRSRPEHRDIPVIMMSAAIQPHGLDPSIAAFMPKPFDLTELVELVVRLIGHPHANGCA
jgi:CheY-like chemotaxis protein